MIERFDHDLIRVHVRRALDLTPPATDEHGRLANLAYLAYAACVGGVNYRGEPMPRWEDLAEHQRAAWEAVAMVLSMAVIAELEDATKRSGVDLGDL